MGKQVMAPVVSKVLEMNKPDKSKQLHQTFRVEPEIFKFNQSGEDQVKSNLKKGSMVKLNDYINRILQD